MHDDNTPEMVMRIDGFEACELGACKTWDNGRLVTRMIYDGQMMIDILVEDGMSFEDAVESVDRDVVGDYRGDSSPIVLMRVNMLEGFH